MNCLLLELFRMDFVVSIKNIEVQYEDKFYENEIKINWTTKTIILTSNKLCMRLQIIKVTIIRIFYLWKHNFTLLSSKDKVFYFLQWCPESPITVLFENTMRKTESKLIPHPLKGWYPHLDIVVIIREYLLITKDY